MTQSPITGQKPGTATGVTLSFNEKTYEYEVNLDRGLRVKARELDTGSRRRIADGSRVYLFRAVATQWLIVGVIPLFSNNVSTDRTEAEVRANQPREDFTPSYRGPTDYVPVNTADKIFEAKRADGFARVTLTAVGAILMEAGSACSRYISSGINAIKDLCYKYILSTPGFLLSAVTDAVSRTVRFAINLQPNLYAKSADNINFVAGADAVAADKKTPNPVTVSESSGLTPITPGRPGVGFSLGAFVKALIDSQAGSMRVTLGGNELDFDLDQLRVILASTEFSLNKTGNILLKNGTQSIQMKLDELIFTLTALTLTIQGATKLTAKSIEMVAAEKFEVAAAVTVLQKYKFVEDLITTLNTQWAVQFAAHTHGTPVGPTTPAGTPFPPITPSG